MENAVGKESSAPPGRVLIRRPELRRRVPLSDTRIWELEQAGEFPRRIQLTARCVAWDAAEVDAWIAARAAWGVTAAAVPTPTKARKRHKSADPASLLA